MCQDPERAADRQDVVWAGELVSAMFEAVGAAAKVLGKRLDELSVRPRSRVGLGVPTEAMDDLVAWVARVVPAGQVASMAEFVNLGCRLDPGARAGLVKVLGDYCRARMASGTLATESEDDVGDDAKPTAVPNRPDEQTRPLPAGRTEITAEQMKWIESVVEIMPALPADDLHELYQRVGRMVKAQPASLDAMEEDPRLDDCHSASLVWPGTQLLLVPITAHQSISMLGVSGDLAGPRHEPVCLWAGELIEALFADCGDLGELLVDRLGREDRPEPLSPKKVKVAVREVRRTLGAKLSKSEYATLEALLGLIVRLNRPTREALQRMMRQFVEQEGAESDRKVGVA